MKRHLKFVLYLAAIALVALLIFDLKKTEGYDKAPALKKIATAEFLHIKLLDIFLGVLGLAFVGIAAGYVASLVKGAGKRDLTAVETQDAAATGSVEEPPRKKFLLEKILGRTGSRILSALVMSILVLLVVAVLVTLLFLLFPDKMPFLRELLTGD